MMPVIFEDYLKPIFGTVEGEFILRNGDFFATKRPECEVKVRIHRRGDAKKLRKNCNFVLI